MGFLRSWFGLNRAEIWRQLADEVDGRFVDGGYRGDKVTVRVGEWTLTLDVHLVQMGKTVAPFTRMRAPYVNADGFRFDIYRETIFSGLGRALGMQDVTIGVPDIDAAFVIKGTSEARLRTLFADPEVAELLCAQPKLRLRVKDDEGSFRPSFPEGVDELHFEVGGAIEDIPRLKALFDLFATVLDRLCRMGSAYERDPGVKL